MTVNITGSAITPSGAVKKGAVIRFRRSPVDVVAVGVDFVIPDDIVVRTASDGTVDFDILPGQYIASTRAIGNDGVQFAFNVPDVASANFVDCVASSWVPIPPASVVAAQEARDAAIAAAAQAEDAAALAEDAADRAEFAAGSTPEDFGAVGDGVTDDTASLILWMENGGKMTANGQYLVAAAGPDAGGAYAQLLNDVDFRAGPDCRFIAGLGLDNDVLRYTLPISVYNDGKRPSITWRGGVIDQTLQANSVIIPNSEFYPPIRPGVSQTTDGFYVIGWVQSGGVYYPGLSRVTVEGVRFISGDHWETAGGDSQLFISGTKTVEVRNNEFIGARDCGFYGSCLPDGVMPDVSFTVTDNVFRACNWGAAVKRIPSNLVMTGNRGFNTPQLLVFQGLTGTGGAGAVIANNIATQAWQVVRVDDVTGVDIHSNISIDHGCLLAGGTTPTAVYNSYNTVVRMQGCTDCRVHGNILASIDPAAAGTTFTVVQLNAGSFVAQTTNCDVFDNRSFAGTSIVEERSGEANGNRFFGNIGPDTMTTPVIILGTDSTNADALTHWTTNTTTLTGTTDATSLRSSTVRAKRVRRSGDRVSFSASGTISGTANGKRIYADIGSGQFLFGTLTGEGEWVLDGTATWTGGASVRVSMRLTTSTGQTFSRAGTAGITAGASWDIGIRGQLINSADTITLTSLRVD